jgi:hypothetical protein
VQDASVLYVAALADEDGTWGDKGEFGGYGTVLAERDKRLDLDRSRAPQ